MNFFKKQGVAITITIILIVAALAIGFFGSAGKTEYAPESAASASGWAKEHAGEYQKFIRDDAGLLSASTEETLARIDAELDYTYASIMAVAVVDGLDGADIEDAAYDYGYELGCGESDLMLLIDTASQDWYLVWGEDMAYFVNNELEIIFRSYMGEKVFSGSADKQLQALYTDLADWYADTIPVADAQGQTGSSGSGLAAPLLPACLRPPAVPLIGALCARPRRTYYAGAPRSSGGFWRGMFLGSMLGNHHHHTPPPPHNPPPPPRGGAGFGGGANRSSGPRPGGFGGGSRSSFGGGSRGGFGGGSRGGFGGGGRGGFGGGRR